MRRGFCARRAVLLALALSAASACSDDGLDVGSAQRPLTVADCPPGTNIIEGTPGDDTLRGTNRDDCILGYGGDDTIIGRRGNDFLAGGDGDDVLDGGGGDDAVFGEAGQDLLLGGPGNDTLRGGDQSDVLDGEGDIDDGAAEGGNDAIATETESADGGDAIDICIGTSCESDAYRTCKKDDDCAPDGRCLHGYACVSCADDPTCRGGLSVSIDVDEACPEGYEKDNKAECVDVDECRDGTATCDALAGCVNEPGTYRCECPATHYGHGLAPDGCHALVTDIAAGRWHTCALLADGRVKCWGRNDRGQLGLGDTTTRGRLPGDMADGLGSVDLGRSGVVRVRAGEAFSCALTDAGAALCWGDNAFGQLGVGDTSTRGDEPAELGASLAPVDLGGVIVGLSLGATHACATLEGGTAKCWGDNQSGALGLGDTEPRGDGPGEMGGQLPGIDFGASGAPSAVLAGTSGGSCAWLGDGSVACWGSGADGLAGAGDTLDRGDEPGEMGVLLARVPLPTSGLAGLVVRDHACVLDVSGAVSCWGANDSGQLGYGDVNARGDQPGEMGTELPTVDLGGPVVAIFGTWGGPCALLASGATKCWGDNAHGALGLGDVDDRGDEPSEMGNALSAVELGTALPPPVRIVGGAHHRCVLFADGRVKCWGSGEFGQHGLGTGDDVGAHSFDMGDALPFVDFGH